MVQVVGTTAPITDIQAAIRSHGKADRPKAIAALDQGLHGGGHRGAVGFEDVTFHPMIAPGGDQQSAAVFLGEGGGIEMDDLARRFARAVHHGQGAEEFAVPGDERMDAGASVFVTVPVITVLHHMQQSAWRAVSGVVVDSKDSAP